VRGARGNSRSYHDPGADLSQGPALLGQQLQLFAQARIADEIVYPCVAPVVDRDALGAEADLQQLGLTRVVGGKARHRVGVAVGDPDPVLPIDGQMERTRDPAGAVDWFTVHDAAEQARLTGLALRDEGDLAVVVVERSDIAARGRDDTLHSAELAAEIVPRVG